MRLPHQNKAPSQAEEMMVVVAAASPAGIGKHSAALIACGDAGLHTYHSDHVPFRQ